jgi:chromosome segregation ATPase
MYKKLRAISINHLGKEFKRIWNEIAEIKESISELKTQNVTGETEISDDKKSVENLIAETAGQDNKDVTGTSEGDESKELTDLEKAKLKAESLGIKVHHKAKIESIQKLIDEKENA